MEYVYGLGTLNPTDKETQGTDWVMKSLLDLSEEEYEKCVQACFSLDAYKRDSQLFQVVLWNEQEFRELLEKYLTAYSERNFEGLPPRSPDLNLNKCLLNLLSSIRSYLDYVETNVKRKYGKTSSNAIKFKKNCSDAYDGSFSYRFLYRFRNYAQHCGLPLTRILLNGKTPERDSERVHWSLDVGVDRDELLEAAFNWGSIREEIANQPAMIDVPYHVREMMDRLKEIHSNYVVDEFVALQVSASYVKGLTQKIPIKVSELHLFRLSTDSSDPIGKIDCRMQVVRLDLVEDVFDERFAILFDDEPSLKSV
jgi:hypothetical protein